MRGSTWASTLATIVRDIPKRPFALVGFAAFVLMLPLAATSFNRAIKALGAARWQALHRLVHAIVLLGAAALLLDALGEAATSARWRSTPLIVALLLGWRLWRRPAPERAA